jgi:hypothetical protein
LQQRYRPSVDSELVDGTLQITVGWVPIAVISTKSYLIKAATVTESALASSALPERVPQGVPTDFSWLIPTESMLNYAQCRMVLGQICAEFVRSQFPHASALRTHRDSRCGQIRYRTN